MIRKILKIVLISFGSIIFLGLIISTIGYINYWAKDPEVLVVEEYLNYFHETYDDCRSAFRKEAQFFSDNQDSVLIGNIHVESMVDSDLTVDWCYIPPKFHKEKLLVVTSGLHGIEGYAGSAVQLMFMDKILNYKQQEDIGVLLIHGMNPYGLKYRRKVTENNIDLNRNCAVKADLFESKNDGYSKLSNMLMPQGKLDLNSFNNRFFHWVAIKKIVQESMPVLRQAALQGQYQFDKGIYYGGRQPEPQIREIGPFLKKIMEEYNVVLNLDLHTGYGERGKLHLFLNPINDSMVKNGIETIFKGSDIDWGDSGNFYTIKGEYIGWANSLPDSVLCLPMLFEFGTLDSQTTYGSLKSIQIMINENQGIHYGYKNKKSEDEIKRLFSEMYYPVSTLWRTKVIADSYQTMDKMLKNFQMYTRE
jgi:hypothetical protein